MSGAGGLDWGRMNVLAIWSLLDGDNLEHAANRPNDWGNLSAALQESKRRLDAAAQQLETVWPASSNPAAQALQDHISVLSGSMQETLAKAAGTKSGLNGVITALSTAKDTVGQLKQQRESKSHDLIPRQIDRAEDHLDTQAQQAMVQAEAAVSDHSAQLQAPLLYELTVGSENVDGQKLGGPTGDGSGRSTLRAEPKDVTTSTRPSFDYPVTGGGTSTGVGSTGHLGAGAAGHGGSAPPAAGASGSTGPVLTGVTPPVLPPAGSLPTTGVAVTLPAGGSGSLPSSVGVLPIGAGTLTPGLTDGGAARWSGGADAIGVRTPVAIRTAMPSGAVIGGRPETGIGASTAAPGQTPMGTAGRVRPGQRSGDDVNEGEADQLWQTAQGVLPVIEPIRSDDRHDPGPGVIGYSR